MLGEDFTWLQMVGYFVTIAAFTGYSALKAQPVKRPPLTKRGTRKLTKGW